MVINRSYRTLGTALMGATLAATSQGSDGNSGPLSEPEPSQRVTDQNKYVGMWVTRDGYVRHELLPGGRYDEARGNRKSAYQGRYTLDGDHIDYVDDTGFTADGDFRDGVLYHGGMILYRESEK